MHRNNPVANQNQIEIVQHIQGVYGMEIPIQVCLGIVNLLVRQNKTNNKLNDNTKSKKKAKQRESV